MLTLVAVLAETSMLSLVTTFTETSTLTPVTLAIVTLLTDTWVLTLISLCAAVRIDEELTPGLIRPRNYAVGIWI